MRKLLTKVFFLAVLTALLLTVTAAAAGIGTGVVDADSLRVRSQPSTSSATVTYLIRGTRVEVLEDLGDWYKVSWGSYTGYVSAEYLIYTPAAGAVSAAPAPEAELPAPAVTAPDLFTEPELPMAMLPAPSYGQQGVLTTGGVFFWGGPSVASEVYGAIDKDTCLTVLSVNDGWCRVDWNGQEGYVKAAYISVNGIPLVDPKGVVTGDCVNVRDIPSTDGSILTKVYAGATVDLIDLAGGWYTVSCNGVIGYINSDYLRVYDPNAVTSGLGADVVAKALEFLGTPYSYGGASPRGFDCSGFTMYVYGLFGYSLPHSATSQWNSTGTYVERSDLQPGDLVLFCDPSRSNGKACSHVGIYIGDNQFVHASSGSSGKYIRISSLSEDYYNGYYVGAKRVA